MPNQKNAQGGFPKTKAAKNDEHSTTGDGHPPRKQSKANQSTTETQGARTGSRASGSGSSKSGVQAPSRQKK